MHGRGEKCMQYCGRKLKGRSGTVGMRIVGKTDLREVGGVAQDGAPMINVMDLLTAIICRSAEGGLRRTSEGHRFLQLRADLCNFAFCDCSRYNTGYNSHFDDQFFFSG
jgi:hypothetical protein